MKLGRAYSLCECQARLVAELDEKKQVLRGSATELRRGKTRVAPAHAIHGERPRFQIAWACPFCGRNTLRSFDTAGIAFVEQAVPDTSAEI
ncbi:MAG: hypothetical protein U0263_14805 [Polyangiaceae bacterium]